MKAYYVIKREYSENIRKKSFIISTLLAPIILIALYSIPVLSMLFVPSEQISIAVLDHTGRVADPFIASLTDTLKDGRPKFAARKVISPGADDRSVREDLTEQINLGLLGVLIEIPKDGITSGRIRYISKDVFNERTMDRLRDLLNTVVIQERFTETGLDYERVASMTTRIRFEEMKVTRSGVLEQEAVFFEFILVIVFIMILYMSLLSWGMSVQRSIIEEKSSRVIEVMLSSVEPRDLFLGKIIGVGSLGLTQLVMWSVIIFALGSASSLIPVAQFMDIVSISITDLAFFCLFFVLGFMFYSSMFTIIGAVCSTEQDAQQLQPIVILPLVIPMMVMWVVIQNPNTTWSVVMSLIPLFSPMLMLARIVLTDVPAWEIALCIAILVVSIYGVILFSARIFRIGILMYGKRPGIREIAKWFRYA